MIEEDCLSQVKEEPKKESGMITRCARDRHTPRDLFLPTRPTHQHHFPSLHINFNTLGIHQWINPVILSPHDSVTYQCCVH